MSSIIRTTSPLDAEIILPDAVLTTETALYKSWLDTFVSANPIETQVEFFTNLAAKIHEGIDIELYHYWYNKAKTSHPIVLSAISDIAYIDVNESTGTLYFADVDNANVAIISLSSTPIKPYPNNIASLLPTGLDILLNSAYSAVNVVYVSNIRNIQTNLTAQPSDAHGVSLVKDTLVVTRNTASKTVIKTELEDKYTVALDLTEIENNISGEISITAGEYTTDIEGVSVKVDDLGNKIDPTESTLNINSLKAE